MHIVVIGGAGVLGQALLRAIVERGVLTRSDGAPAPVRRVIAVDHHQPARLFVESRIEYVRADLGNPRLMTAVMGTVTDSVFHAWDLGDRPDDSDVAPTFALVDSLRDLFAACAAQSAKPKVVLASTFGADRAADVLAPATFGCPLPSTYEGLRSRVAELVLAEAVRRGIIDGRALRLPLIASAPGCASFVGALVASLRESAPARCPLPPETSLWLTSAAAAARALVHAHELPAAPFVQGGVLNAPARALSVQELISATSRLAGRPLDAPIVEPDLRLCETLARLPPRVAVDASLQLGFEAGPDAEALVRELLAPAR